ncbi:hypothetical protein EcWSU1_03815 [Enterobacter ludwigii]|uniref:Uncharacterized protein n=1 Tax=Enterobacter ludwigii TaxID=299767 RepID=G8LEK2_9ENTR|nr:hypothetical protein EcWSU1_03815 [Enterobacter ludwigii]
MTGATGIEELTPARHHGIHRCQLILRFAAGIPAPGGKDKICIQLGQTLGADVNSTAVRDGLNQRRECESCVTQHAPQRVVAVHGVDFALVGLYHRHGDVAGVDGRFQGVNLLLIATFKDLQPGFGARELCQLAVDLRRAAIEMIDTHRRGNFLQLFNRRVTGWFGDDQIRLCSGDGLDVDIRGADKFDVGVIKINARQHAAGAQKMATVRPRAPVACHWRHAELNQRNGDIQIVQRDNPLRVKGHSHLAVQIVGKRLRRLRRTHGKPHQQQHRKKYTHHHPLKSVPSLPEQQQEKRSANQ